MTASFRPKQAGRCDATDQTGGARYVIAKRREREPEKSAKQAIARVLMD